MLAEDGQKPKLNVYGIVECYKSGSYKGSVTAELERSLSIYKQIFENQGQMVGIAGNDGKTRYYRLKGRRN